MIDPRIREKFAQAHGFDLDNHLVLLARVGSHSHGTYLAPDDPCAVDDIDYMGFVVPPLDYHLGLKEFEHWTLQFEDLDVVLYSLQKAFRLLLKGNPNIIGTLWLRPDDYVWQLPEAQWLFNRRALFSSKAAADAFHGYAYGQLKRMEAFDVGRMAEYEQLTTMLVDRGLTPQAVLAADANKLHHLASSIRTSAELLNRFRKLHKEYFSGYMGTKRKGLVKRYGYDVKNAAHLIRLLRMGKEFLETGELQVYRTADAQELRDIKRGEWTLQQVKDEADRLFAGLRVAETESPLSAVPDVYGANQLLVRMQRSVLLDSWN